MNYLSRVVYLVVLVFCLKLDAFAQSSFELQTERDSLELRAEMLHDSIFRFGMADLERELTTTRLKFLDTWLNLHLSMLSEGAELDSIQTEIERFAISEPCNDKDDVKYLCFEVGGICTTRKYLAYSTKVDTTKLNNMVDHYHNSTELYKHKWSTMYSCVTIGPPTPKKPKDVGCKNGEPILLFD